MQEKYIHKHSKIFLIWISNQYWQEEHFNLLLQADEVQQVNLRE